MNLRTLNLIYEQRFAILIVRKKLDIFILNVDF